MTHPNINDLHARRLQLMKTLSEMRGRNVVAYYSGFWQLDIPQASIAENDVGALLDVVRYLDHNRGLDLLLHTPGGSIGGAEAIGNYLYGVFGTDIEVFVPMTAMSAGTMIACLSRKIHMGKQSSLGPIDPQINNNSIGDILDGFKYITKKITKDPSKSDFFAAILKDQYSINLIPFCKQSIELSKEIVDNWLKKGMFHEDKDGCRIAESITDKLSDHKKMKSHNRKLGISKVKEIGLKVVDMAEDINTEEIVLNIHRLYMDTLTAYRAYKIVENH